MLLNNPRSLRLRTPGNHWKMYLMVFILEVVMVRTDIGNVLNALFCKTGIPDMS
jgi:hypothetical protein